MRAVPPTLGLLWQTPAHDAGCGGIVFEFNNPGAQSARYPVRASHPLSGLHMTTLSIDLRSGPSGSGPSFCKRRTLADGAEVGKFPFSTAMDAVESGSIKTLTRGSQKWSRNTHSSHRSLRSHLLAASKAATAIPRPPTARPSAPSVALLRAHSLQMQPAVPKPVALLSAQSRVAARACCRASTTAIDLISAAKTRRGLITENSKTGSFSHIGWKALFICRAGSGPILPEGRESRCSRKS
jgi:hypothetical protein